jgi:nucleotide-binding universal stress UspA family protein
MFKKILVPLDGSKRAEKILSHVEDLARRYDKSKVVLIQVVEPLPVTVNLGDYVPPLDQQELDRENKDARAYLERLQARLRKKGIHAQVYVVLGPVVATIVDLAVREKVDLIALASHGRSGLNAFFYGSVAAGVLHRTDRPLLIVRSVQLASGQEIIEKKNRRAGVRHRRLPSKVARLQHLETPS